MIAMNSLPTPARYLLRIDDLCPTVHARLWNRLRDLIQGFGIQPILAVVPDNRDPELQTSPPDSEFWAQMRDLQESGATIALHGFNHVCSATGRSLLPLHRHTEFAGLDYHEQTRRIAQGLEILRGHGLNPELWVAPRHGFDRFTLRALRNQGIHYLSDGFARIPHLRGGLVWIPMQLWAPVAREKGLWTICLHPNTMDTAAIEQLRGFLLRHVHQFTSFDRVVADFPSQPLSGFEHLYRIAATLRVLRRAQKRRHKHH